MRPKTILILLLMFLFASGVANSVEVYADAGHGKKEERVEKKKDSEEEGHHHPENWVFRLPQGDRDAGRKTFLNFGCQSCHEVKGESFKKPEGEAVGSELSQMGPMHPLEYFAESIINPSAEIWPKTAIGPDGKSKMPSFNEDMTVQELIDLSAYLASLRPPGMAKSVTGEGKVIAVVAATQQIVVEHGEIKGFMEAMTMGYKVSPASLLNNLKAGDQIRFTIDTEKKAIVEIVDLKN